MVTRIYPTDWKTQLKIFEQFGCRYGIGVSSGSDALLICLIAGGSGTAAIDYQVPLHLQQYFANLGYQAGSCMVSEEAAKRTIALPIYPELTFEQQNYVVNAITEGLS